MYVHVDVFVFVQYFIHACKVTSFTNMSVGVCVPVEASEMFVWVIGCARVSLSLDAWVCLFVGVIRW